MAILKDLIVHGSSRFLNKIYASEIQTPLIDAEAGIFKKLKADDATIVGLLDVQGQMHTNSWTNSNIATIDGSFYITPTLSSSSGTVSFSSATAATFTGTYSAVSSLYIGNDTASTVQWTSGSKILITGEVQVDEEWIPLGTLLGTLNSTNPTTSMPIVNITDNRNNTSNILTNIYSLKDNASLNYRNLKISLYQRADNSQYYPLGIYITALGQNGKTFLDIYGGVNALTTSYGGYANPNVRIGNLSGLPAITTAAGNFSPVGWGIYTTNGYFSGTIVSNTGVIGGWKLGASSLYNGTTGLNNTTAGIYLGTDGIRNYKDTNTYVNITQGVITAKGVDLTGAITATSGTIGGFQIDSSSIHTNNVAITSNVDNSIALSSADFTRTINNTTRAGLRFAIGDKFGVTGNGTIYASSVDLTGKITATSGTIGGIDIIDGNLNVSSINIGDLNGASNYALKTEITDAEKVATSYITYIDSTEGIKIHNVSDQVNYLKLNSSAISMYRNDIETLNISNNEIRIGKFSDNNVYIDSDSVDIRNGTTTLASFTGDNTRFYDPIYNKELATFGTSGAIIGANNEQRFIIEKDGIKSINDSGATVFSVNSTEGTVVTEAEVAPSGETKVFSSVSITLDTVGSGSSVDVTFYNKSMTAIFAIEYCNSNLTNVKVNSVSSSAIQTSTPAVGVIWSTYSIDLPPFIFTHGTAQTTTYTITASFVNTFGDSYNLTAVETVTYDGAITITLSSLDGECVRTSGNNEKTSLFLGMWSKVIYGEIYQSSAYTKAPAMTFGTRGKNAILAPFSVTIGESLYANNDNQLSIGKYNLNDDEFSTQLAFAIGNGTSDTDRSNAFTVDWDGNVEFSGNMYCAGGNYLPSNTNIDNLTKKHSGWWIYSRSDTSGTFPITDTYGTIGHIQGTSDNVAMQFLRSNTQGATNPILYTRYKIGGTWGAWQRYVSATTTNLTITRIDNKYCTAQDISYLLAYKKGGFLSLLGNLHVSNASTSNVSETNIASISGWNGIPATMTLPGQWSPSGSRPLFVSVRENGLISIGAYSGLLAADWYRFFLTVPCFDGYE